MQDTPAVPVARPEQRWEPLTPEQVQERFAGIDAPWWIAGGRALDLFIGHETRAHVDLDVAILRRDQRLFRERLATWDVQIAHAGSFLPWPRDAEISAPEHHEAWARETRAGPWRVELLLEDAEGTRWAYRRLREIGLNVADLAMRTESGIPYMRPEVQLLYKSKEPRPVDETDFLYVVQRLSPAQKSWLAAALWTTDPKHRWLERLK